MAYFKAFLCSAFIVFAGSVHAKGQAQEIYFSELLDGDGQSIANVRSMFTDAQGFMWFGGDAGVFRFDGFDLLEVNPEPTRALYQDKSGRFWSGGTTALSALIPGTFQSRFYPHLSNRQPKPEQEIIYDMLQTRNGRHFFATKEGLSEYHLLTDSFSHFTLYYQRRAVAVTQLFEAANGDIYLGTDNGLFILDTQQLSAQFELSRPLLTNMRVTQIAQLPDGGLLVGSNNGLYTLDGKIGHFTYDAKRNDSISNNNVTALLVDNELRIWVGTGKGLNLFDKAGGNFQRFFHHSDNRHGIKNNFITDIYQDHQDNILIATYEGINRFNRAEVFINPGSPGGFEGQTINNVWSLAEQSDGVRWVGTFGSGLFRAKGDNVTNYTLDINDRHSLLKNRVSSLLLDHSGQLIVGTTKGLQRFDADKAQFKTIEQVNSSVYDIVETKRGALWLAAANGVYHLTDNDKTVQHFGKNSPLKVVYKQWVRSVYERDGLLLAGSDKGLNVLDLKRRLAQLFESAGSVLKIMEDSEGNVWVLAMQGLSLFDLQERSSRAIADVTTQPGDANGCNGMVEDDFKQLWLVCNNSLKVLDIKTKQLVKTYSVEQGIDLKGFLTGAQSIMRAKDGRILVAQRQGVTAFTPPQLQWRSQPGNVVLSRVHFSDAEGAIYHSDNPFNLPVERSQALTHELDKIELEFSTLDYSGVKPAKFLYRLVGYDKRDHQTGTDNRRAVYTNLPGGEYRFEVTAVYPDGSKSRADYDFVIAVPFWQSWWAYSFYCILLVLFGFAVVTVRTRALTKRSHQLEQQVALRTGQLQQSKQEVEQLMVEREKLIENIYHQTRTPLQIMLGNIDGLLDGSLSKNDFAEKQSEHVHSLVNLTDRILNVTKSDKPQHLDMHPVDFTSMLNTLCLGYSDVIKAKQLTFDYSVDNHMVLWADEGCLRSIVENVIENAIKYTDKGGIGIYAMRQGKQLVLRCVDSGIGIPEKAQQKIFERYQRADNATDRKGSGIGLAMVNEMVALHGGKVSLKSELGKGTSVNISFAAMAKDIPTALELPEAIEAVTDERGNATLLLVEDNLELAGYMNKLLAPHYNVLMAINGRDGLEQAKRHVPDLILSDVMMPQMDGFALTQALREDEVTCHIPLLLITAKNDQNSREKGFALGANDFINKPFKSAELLCRVANQLALIDAVKIKLDKEKQITTQIPQDESQDRLIARYLGYIESHYQQEELQIKAVCEALHVSNRQLERKVKHFLNMTPNAFLNEYRLIRAAELIEQGQKPNQVYQLCGFGSHAYFSKRFKQKFDELPSQYKKAKEHA